MKISERFGAYLTKWIKETMGNKTEEELEIIQYGIEVIFMDVTKTAIILAIAYMLSILKYTLFAMVAFGVPRYFAAGMHARKGITCLFSTLMFMFGAVYLSIGVQLSIFEKVLIFLPSLYVYCKYAPADTEEKPYVNPMTRQQLKRKSIAVVSIYLILSICIKSGFFSNIFIHMIWMEAILINPITYKIFDRRYNNYEYYKDIV